MRFFVRAVPLLLVSVAFGIASEELTGDDLDFFERRVRPLLTANCYACHSETTVASGGLRLDSKAAIRQGGERGPAVSPGNPEASLLLQAVSHQTGAPAMPPTGRLETRDIETLREWIVRGAPDPRTPGGKVPGGERLWSLEPFEEDPLPAVADPDWPSSPIDRFVLAKLEEQGLRPAPPADKRTLLRRVTFDLTGLPPTPREIQDFLADDSPAAYEKVVERLLASRRYGERWARHWLDLARYAETAGHEFDQEKPDAWRYRDYVIRAFNEDLPYDRFIREQIAGDLLPNWRLSSDGTVWETPVATGFWGLGEERNAADDLAEVRADKVDNMLDVMGKAFLGLAIGCARCHDHKFDPISINEYYGLAGVLHSSQIIQGNVDAPARRRKLRRLRAEIDDVNGRIAALLRPTRLAIADDAIRMLRSAMEYRAKHPDCDGDQVGDEQLRPWVSALYEAAQQPDQALYPAAALSLDSPIPFPERVAQLVCELDAWAGKAAKESHYRKKRGDLVFEDFDAPLGANWEVHGAAFGETPSFGVTPNQSLRSYAGSGVANSFAGSNRFTGLLVSRSFRVPRPYLHVRLAGGEDQTHGRQPGKLRLELWSDGRFARTTGDESGRFSWRTISLAKQPGEVGFFQIVDRSEDGHLAIDQIVFSDSKEPPAVVGPPNRRLVARLAEGRVRSLEDLILVYAELFREAIIGPEEDAANRSLAAAIAVSGSLEDLAYKRLSPERRKRLEELQKQRREFEAVLPDSAYAMLCVDDRPQDVAVHLRGDHRNLGEPAPRRFLAALSAGNSEPFQQGSGRLELAEAIASPNNPLTARVMVNRIWKQHFGEGLVRTPDNFGVMGEAPTHPELLDALAARFVRNGWSVKQMHRLILLSSVYRMSSQADEDARAIDGENRLLHSFPVRRIEAEAVRDAILAVTGSLDDRSYGPPVPPHISEYQDGRGKPPSGPLDGRGRRSIYIGVRRNFITPMLLAFDYPPSVTAIGRRTTSAVPSQALALLNNEFVVLQSEKWADRLLAEFLSREDRIEAMFLQAFGRPVRPAESVAVSRFVDEQAERYGAPPDDRRVWTDLAHSLINAKEFLFLR